MRNETRIGRTGGGRLRIGVWLPLLTLAACGGDEDGDGSTGPGPTRGSVQVTASTAGEDPDPDGYTVTLDSGAGQALGVNATTTFADVEPGDHDLELEDVASNCTVDGANPRAVSVTVGATAEATFEVACLALGPVPARLAFTRPPEETELHQPIAAVEVTILDEDGEPVSTATQEVTVTLGANPGDSAPTEPVRPAILGGTTTVSAVDGVARFEDLAIDRRGSGYTLVAEAEGLEGAESEPFDVTFAWEDVTAGRLHTCARTPSAVAYCWGLNNFGQLGDGSAGVDRDVPVAVATDVRFRELNAGGNHTCGVTPDDEVYCWGNNDAGQLGDGRDGTDSATPRLVGAGIRLRRVSAGHAHTCGLTQSGDAWCWGSNLDGKLGNGTNVDHDVPVPVETNLTFREVAAGQSHTCARAATDDVYCWGSNLAGQLGDNTTNNSTVPVLVQGGHTFVQVGAGTLHACALTVSNEAFCWGHNRYGQLGDGKGGPANLSSFPVKVVGEIVFAVPSLFVGADHSCAFDFLNQRGVCWGRNDVGQLGDGLAGTNRDDPVPIATDLAFRHSRSDAGGRHTCGVTKPGEAFCWGLNDDGQLGDGNAGTNSDTPVGVLDPP